MRHNYFNYIESYADFPKKDIVFWDFTPLHNDPAIFNQAIQDILQYFSRKRITRVVAIEAKGFIIGSALAVAMHVPLSLIRKPGLIPGEVISEQFIKEYGIGEYQMKVNSLAKNDRVLLVYDILAGAGATQAAINLIERSKGQVVGCAYIIELNYLHGREKLTKYDIYSLVKIQKKQLK